MALAVKIAAVWLVCIVLAVAAWTQAHRYYRWRGWDDLGDDLGWPHNRDADEEHPYGTSHRQGPWFG